MGDVYKRRPGVKAKRPNGSDSVTLNMFIDREAKEAIRAAANRRQVSMSVIVQDLAWLLLPVVEVEKEEALSDAA